MMKKNLILRGGNDLERLYLYNCTLKLDGRAISIKRSEFAGLDMYDVIARHIGRYGVALPYLRPGYKMLDFPCGSGLAVEVLSSVARFGGFSYEGLELDELTVHYCREMYGKNNPWASFMIGDLTNFALCSMTYNVICCIEGIEHIDHNSQNRACAEFAKGLKAGGVLIISSPSPESGKSGPNPKNPFHLWELTREDFSRMLLNYFSKVEIVSQMNILTTGQHLDTFYAVCHK